MLDVVIAYVAMLLLFLVSHPLAGALGLFVPLAFVAADITPDDKEPGFFARLFYLMSLVGIIPIVALMANYAISARLLQSAYFAGKGVFWFWLIAGVVSSIAVFALLRFGRPALNKATAKITRKTDLERNKKTDVREIHKILPAEIGKFDPERYFPKLPENKMFVGLDENKKPVYIDYESWKISHCLLTGRTRSGKGVAAQILLSQAIQRGEYVVILDPKVDNWMPHTFKAQCDRAGGPYRFVDLRQSAGPQINLFEGCDAETLENMMVGGFGLTEKGEAADFYRLADRKAARQAAAWIAEHPGATARDAVTVLGGDWSEAAPAFLSYMQEMAELPAVNRPAGTGGLDVVEGVKDGGVLYVVGDMINPRLLRMQKMILLRLLFLAKNRDQINPGRTILVFADEFKVHISRPFMTSLGASAGWGLHTVLAFQSLQDLADCPADLDKNMVRGGVMENCGIQLSYAIKDPETAEWLAMSTGTVLVDDESRTVQKNIVQSEIVEGRRSIRQAERYLIDTNMLLHMPKGCGVLSVVGRLPVFCYTSPVAAERTSAAIMPTAPALPAAVAAFAAASVAAEALALDEETAPVSDLSSDEAQVLQAEQSEESRGDPVKPEAAALLDLDDY